MLSDDELWNKCEKDEPITAQDLGLPEWRNHTDGIVHECCGYTIYKTPEGYRHQSRKFVTPFQKWLYGLN